MTRSSDRLFYLDRGEGDVGVTVTFDWTPGSPAVTSGPPEYCDPGEGPDVTVTDVLIVESEDPDWPIGTAVTLTPEEEARFYDEAVADLDEDDGPDPDDWRDSRIDDDLTFQGD